MDTRTLVAFIMLGTAYHDLAAGLLRRTEEDVKRRWGFLKHVAARSFVS